MSELSAGNRREKKANIQKLVKLTWNKVDEQRGKQKEILAVVYGSNKGKD